MSATLTIDPVVAVRTQINAAFDCGADDLVSPLVTKLETMVPTTSKGAAILAREANDYVSDFYEADLSLAILPVPGALDRLIARLESDCATPRDAELVTGWAQGLQMSQGGFASEAAARLLTGVAAYLSSRPAH